jgi:hypothetical protein
MRVKLLLVLAVVAALGLTAPAHADFTGRCNVDPYFCVGVDQFTAEDGTSGTFLVVDTAVAGAFAGHESNADTGYAGTGACGGALAGGGCAVLIQDGDDAYLYLDSPAGCATKPLNGGTNDYCE